MSSGGYGGPRYVGYGEKEEADHPAIPGLPAVAPPRKEPKSDAKKDKKDTKKKVKGTKEVSRGGYGYPENGDYGEDGSMGPYGNIGGLYGGAYAGGYGGYGTYGAYSGEDGVLTYDINAEGAPRWFHFDIIRCAFQLYPNPTKHKFFQFRWAMARLYLQIDVPLN